jgi:DNA-binding transcriptional ArsR family regulator
MSADDADVESVADLLADETVREILTRTSVEPMSASSLKDHCEASGPTIYRRLERLREADFLVERTRPDPEGGHHRKVYAPNLDHVRIDLDAGRLTVRIARQETMSDRFTRFVEDI